MAEDGTMSPRLDKLLLPPPLTDEEIAAAVAEDPDAVPIMSGAEIEALFARAAERDRHGVGRLRRRLGITQAEFASRYGVPLSTLRQWEQGVAEPDRAAKVLLAVIAAAPELVARVVAGLPRAA
jgi:putative transcriptional regulator